MVEPIPTKRLDRGAIVSAVSEKRGQLDALLDVELVLARTEATACDTPATRDPPTEPMSGHPSAAELVAGTLLGKYRLDRLLGAGGMGAVWDAHDTDLDRRVALKVLRRGYDGARGRLVRESRAMARLRHPNVITVFDATTIGDREVIAMELVEGESRGAARAPTHGEIVATIVSADAIGRRAYGWSDHRDFKPHNVLVDVRGRPVVATSVSRASATLDPYPALVIHRSFGALDSP
jgi:serine/threonine protein kinase